MLGRANTFAAYREGDTSRQKGGRGKEREKGGIREHIARRLLRATSCRWCKRDERGVQGIVEVGKLKAEAPFRPADAPLFEKKRRKRKGESEEKQDQQSEIASRNIARAMQVMLVGEFSRAHTR